MWTPNQNLNISEYVQQKKKKKTILGRHHDGKLGPKLCGFEQCLAKQL